MNHGKTQLITFDLYMLFSDVNFNLLCLQWKKLVESCRTWYCGIDIYLRWQPKVIGRGEHFKSHYILSILWKYHRYFLFHFTYFKYHQVVPIFCKTGKNAPIYIKIQTVAMGLFAYLFICSIICIMIIFFFPSICKIIVTIECLVVHLLFLCRCRNLSIETKRSCIQNTPRAVQ